ncbi:MAG: caspase family protein, partial [Bacteroidota bacterium]
MPDKVKEGDRVLFYFGGHGIALDSEIDPNGYFVPVDADPQEMGSLVCMDVLHDVLTQLPCKHGLLILDCCFAGSFQWSTGFRDIFDLPSVIYEERFYQYARDEAWQVITSSASDQKAADILVNRTLGLREEGEELHSPFAQALFDAIDGEGDTIPKDGGDGVITASELFSYLRDRVEDETTDHSKRQSPALFSLERHDKGQYIFLAPNHRLNLPPIPKRNPFMGLNSFNEEDASFFYGRDRVIEALDKIADENQLVVVSGASGTGKSSVIKAGLLPRLREEDYKILPIVRPGIEPLASLEAAIPHIDTFIPNKEQASVLFIDQYEELITQCLYVEEKEAFEQQLLDWMAEFPNLKIILSVRSDFEPQFEEGLLHESWQKGHYLVPAFSQKELREVIVKPTIQEVLFFEPASLVDTLVDAVNQAPGALPLLSFTLSELYHAYVSSGRTNRSLNQEDYENLGGVIGALRKKANSIFEKLDEAHQQSMRKLMLRLVSLKGGEVSSQRVLAKELVFSDESETARIRKVADTLVRARLLTTCVDLQGQKYYEPSHDALVRAWALLWEWIKATGEGKLDLRYRLRTAINDYEDDQEHTKKYLWINDPRLDVVYNDLLLDANSFNQQEEYFIKESMRLRRRRQLIKRAGVLVTLILFGLISLYSINKAQEASNNLTDLRETREKVAKDLIEESQIDIDEIHYERAFEKYEDLAGEYQVFTGNMKEQWKKGMIEVAYFFNKSTNQQHKNRALDAAFLLASMEGDILSNLPDSQEIDLYLNFLDPEWYAQLEKRYIPSETNGNAFGITVRQYALLCEMNENLDINELSCNMPKGDESAPAELLERNGAKLSIAMTKSQEARQLAMEDQQEQAEEGERDGEGDGPQTRKQKRQQRREARQERRQERKVK